MQNVKKKKNLAMPAVSLQGTESSFDFVRVSLLNFIVDAKCQTNKKSCQVRRVIPAVWIESIFNVSHVSLSNFIRDEKLNMLVRALQSLVIESIFYVGHISLSNFIRDENVTKT